MTQVFLGVGSNRQAEEHLPLALDALADRYGELELSSVYESEAVGIAGNNFLNMVVGLQVSDSVGMLSAWLKDLEDRHGRRRSGEGTVHLALDVDILTYGKLVGEVSGVNLPRAEILKNAFVLQPLAEIAGDHTHPQDGRSYAALWQAYERKQKLWKVPFQWRGRIVSPRI